MNAEQTYRGRGAQHNPANRFNTRTFEQSEWEAIDEDIDRSPKTELIPTYPKTIVNPVPSPDIGPALSLNAYQGCEHGCAYCYARNAHEYWGYSAGVDFEQKILYKPEAPELLLDYFRKVKTVQAISMSGNTDCYQPVERELQLTRRLLERFLAHRHPVGLITKNALILRDIDLLSELAKDELVHVYVSLNTLDEEVRRKTEPRTASVKRRLQAIEKLSSAGVPVGVMVAPIIPGLTLDAVPGVLKAVAEAGARNAGYTMVRLNGQVGEIFTRWLAQAFPDRASKVLNQIKSVHGGKLNDSQWGRRMKGGGELAAVVADMFKLYK
ncbi:MAG: PA0069 family radical SAM protein, partial [Bacteroidota bacterium]